MRLNLKGKINSLYVQSLCMMFFRGEKFPEIEENPRGFISVDLSQDENGILVKAHLEYDGRASHCEHYEELSENETDERTGKIATGHAVFGACSELTGYLPPWGLLTGIRPSVVAQELINKYGTECAIDILKRRYLVSDAKARLAVEVAQNEALILNKYDDNTCSIYISIPFCPTRCTYCSFISYATKKLFELMPSYVERIIKDIYTTFELIKKAKLRLATIYIGGGTPTTLDPNQLEMVLRAINDCLGGQALDEFTVEGGRPDTITAEKLEILKKYGVDRISVNPQSLNDEVLVKIGRKHTVKDFFDAYELVKHSKIKIVNTDLIAGLDGDGIDSFKNTINRIIDLSPDNVTVHAFSVKKSAQILQDDYSIYNREGDYAVESTEYAIEALKSKGYIPYYMYRQKNTISDLENVGYAKPGTFCAYNVLMMGDGHTVFGIGAGATTKLVKKTDGKAKILRIFSQKYPYEYLQDNPNVEADVLEFFERGTNK